MRPAAELPSLDPVLGWAAHLSTAKKSLITAAAVLLFGLFWFGNLEYRDLVDPDEGRYAEIPREMVVTGDWVTPRLNDLKYFEKPPLQYWMTAALYSVFGVDEWVARLWPAFAGLLGLVMTAVTARRLYGPAIGIGAPLVLGGLLHYVIFAHILTLDMSVTLFLSITIFAVAIAQDDATLAGARRRWMLVAWAAVAGAMLSKGLIGVVLPVGTVACYVLLHRDWSLLKRLHVGSGLLLFSLLAVPWFVLVSARNPEFARFFFWHEHVERFLLPEHHRPGAWWYFLAIGAAGAVPWIGAIYTRGLLKTDAAKHFQPTRFLALWCVLVLAFFSASSSKLPGYILPIFPALSVLIALNALRMSRRALTIAMASLVPVVAALGVALPAAARLKTQPGFSLYYGAFLPWIEIACAVLALGLAGSALLAWRRGPLPALALASASSLFAITLGMTAHETMAPIYSSAPSHLLLGAQGVGAPGKVPFYSVRHFDPSLAFELERPVTLVDFRGELALGLDAEPAKGIPTLAAFEATWRSADEAFAVMRPETYEELARDGLPMAVLVRDPRRVFVQRRPLTGSSL